MGRKRHRSRSRNTRRQLQAYERMLTKDASIARLASTLTERSGDTIRSMGTVKIGDRAFGSGSHGMDFHSPVGLEAAALIENFESMYMDLIPNKKPTE